MKKFRGAEFRVKLNKLKKRFDNELNKMESDITNEISITSQSDLFNLEQLEWALNEIKYIKQCIYYTEDIKAKKMRVNSLLSFFTDTEKKIIQIIYFNRDITVIQIAQILTISKRTVESHIYNIANKIINDDIISDIIKDMSDSIVTNENNPKEPYKLLKKFIELL